MTVVYDATLIAADRSNRELCADHRARLELGLLPSRQRPSSPKSAARPSRRSFAGSCAAATSSRSLKWTRTRSAPWQARLARATSSTCMSCSWRTVAGSVSSPPIRTTWDRSSQQRGDESRPYASDPQRSPSSSVIARRVTATHSRRTHDAAAGVAPARLGREPGERAPSVWCRHRRRSPHRVGEQRSHPGWQPHGWRSGRPARGRTSRWL